MGGRRVAVTCTRPASRCRSTDDRSAPPPVRPGPIAELRCYRPDREARERNGHRRRGHRAGAGRRPTSSPSSAEHMQLKRVGPAAGRACARSTPRRRRRSRSTPSRGSTTASAARPRATSSPSSARSSTSTSSAPSSGWPAKAGITLRYTDAATRARAASSAHALVEAMDAGGRLVPRAPADRPRRRRGPRLPARRGASTATRSRQYRHRLGARRLGRAGQGAASCPTDGAASTPASASSTSAAGSRTSSGPGCCSRSSTSAATPVGVRRPDAARRRRARSTRTPPRRRSTPRARCSTASTGPRTTWCEADEVDRLRGLHRRHRLRRGRACPGRWPPAARRSPRTTSGCSSASPSASCWPSTPTPPARPRPSGSTSGSASYEVDVAVAALPAGRRPGRPGPLRPRRAARGGRRAPCRSSGSGSTGCSRPADLRTPEGRARAAEAALAVDRRAPERAGPRPVRDGGRRPHAGIEPDRLRGQLLRAAAARAAGRERQRPRPRRRPRRRRRRRRPRRRRRSRSAELEALRLLVTCPTRSRPLLARGAVRRRPHPAAYRALADADGDLHAADRRAPTRASPSCCSGWRWRTPTPSRVDVAVAAAPASRASAALAELERRPRVARRPAGRTRGTIGVAASSGSRTLRDDAPERGAPRTSC